MYNFSKIEKKWQKKWLQKKIYEPDLKRVKKPFYNLMMFPYPSAEGLHVGNIYAFTGADVYGRFKRMHGNDVFEPIGLDGFGIHSENYAIKVGRHPARQAETSEKNFYRQLQMIGNGFAWNERLETYDPAYYKWTQWIFIQLFKAGLAYRKKSPVNWCPSCKTVLADEQVINGKCERCSNVVVRKELEQWFFRITNYAEKLLSNLDRIDWSEKVKIAQRNWIGKSEGAEIDFKIKNSDLTIRIFTTRPDTLFGATYMVLSPEHILLEDGNFKKMITNWKEVANYIKKARAKSDEERIAEGKEKTGVELKGIKAINPVNKEVIPVWVADYVLGHVGTGAIMAVPAHDERDFKFAKKFNLPIIKVIQPVLLHVPNPAARADAAVSKFAIESEMWEGEGELVNSGKFDGMPSERAKDGITNFVDGVKKVQYRLRDWLISRQRYWGPPIPMIFCGECEIAGKGERKDMPGWYSVPIGELPVKLPYIKNFRPTGTDKSPLSSVKKFYRVRCPSCRAWARRETDVSDTFLDSSWYYLRYPSVHEKDKPWNPAITKKWFPVNIYIGGAEHSVLHLLYVRFLAMVFKDLKLIHFEEPFPKFRAHGLIIKDGAKMSKSKGNIVNPDDYIRNFGADALRMYLMFLGPFEEGGDFRDTGVRGITRFLNRVWNFGQNNKFTKKKDVKMEKTIHKTIKKVTNDIENLSYNTAIAALMIVMNEFEKNPQMVDKEQFRNFLKLLASFAPHITEELWKTLGGKNSIHKARWPEYDSDLAKDDTFELLIQVDGKLRAKVVAEVGITEGKAKEIVFTNQAVMKYVSEKGIKKIIFVPDRLINIVT